MNQELNYMKLQLEVSPRMKDYNEEWVKWLVFEVCLYAKEELVSHFNLTMRKLSGKDECLAEEVSIEQLKKLYDFIGLAIKFDEERK